MLRFTDAQRRQRLQARHRIVPQTAATGVAQAAASVVALHASDPATVYLSVLARAPGSTLSDVSHSLYDSRVLVRLMGMRRTLFVVPGELAAAVHHGAALDIAARMRRRIVKDLHTLPTEPEVDADVDAWLTDVEDTTLRALARRGAATAAELSADEPRLRTALLPTTDKPWDVRRTINSRVLTLLGAQGRMVRGQPRGAWTSRAHTWEPAERWWPGGIEPVGAGVARTRIVGHWLRAYGPATIEDVTWWAGWSQTVTRRALAGLETVDVSLDNGATGVLLADDVEPPAPAGPAATLLPALDPTPMGWKHRDWYLGDHRPALFDRNGNIGPTVWWDGRVVGGWAVGAQGTVRTRLLEDAGTHVPAAVDEAAGALEARLEGTVVVPSFRTPLERELSA